MYKLINTIKDYDWGSKQLLSSYFNLDNPDQTHQAELWMGAHPQGSSCVMINDQQISLHDLIQENPQAILGEKLAKQSNTLPYLFKILAIDKPLSIQVHPTQSDAKKGFDIENGKNIPITAPHRKFKDDNHKPELIYALTAFKAMNGFRAFNEMIEYFEIANLPLLKSALTQFELNQTSQGLSDFFSYLLGLDKESLSKCCEHLYQKAKRGELPKDCTDFVITCYNHYKHDVGVFSPLLLHCVCLSKGQSMFLHAQTLHAYVSGLGMEIMANSDNVLRAGLTSKYIDTQSLIENTQFTPKSKQTIFCDFTTTREITNFNIPVKDFSFQLLDINPAHQLKPIKTQGAEIIFCIDGMCSIQSTDTFSDKRIMLNKGESAIITAQTSQYQIHTENHHSAWVARSWSGL